MIRQFLEHFHWSMIKKTTTKKNSAGTTPAGSSKEMTSSYVLGLDLHNLNLIRRESLTHPKGECLQLPWPNLQVQNHEMQSLMNCSNCPHCRNLVKYNIWSRDGSWAWRIFYFAIKKWQTGKLLLRTIGLIMKRHQRQVDFVLWL